MSYPYVDTPTPADSAAPPDPPRESPQQRIERRVRDIQFDLIDACARIIDTVGRPNTPHMLAIADRRRQFANVLQAAKLCHHRTCRRVQSCQGEPTRCLSVLLPALGLDRAAEALMPRQARKRGRKERRL